MSPGRRPLVALTGATGFIGRHVLKELLKEGFPVKVLVRPSSLSKIAPLCERYPNQLKDIQGDLLEEGSLRSLLQGSELFIHIAGAVRGEDFETFARVNTKGILKLIRILRELKPPPPFLFVSSLAARHPYLSPYALSKRLSEELIQKEDLPWVILRPPAVYGPGDRELGPLIRLILRGIVPVFGDLEHRFSLIHVFDLSRALVAWVKKPTTGKIYEIHDGKRDGYSWKEVAEIAAKIRGKPVRLLRVSSRWLRPIGVLNQKMARLWARPPMLTPGKVNELFHHCWVCEDDALRRDLSWEPVWDLEKGLRSFLEKV